jgi:WD40 repeat protein
MGAVVWDAETGKRLHGFEPLLDDGPRAMAFSTDGKLLAVAFKKRVGIYDTETFKETRNLGDQLEVTALAFSPDGKQLALGIRMKVLQTGEAQNPHVVGHGTRVRLLDIATEKLVKSFGFTVTAHIMEAITKLPVTTLAFSADGKKLIAGTGLVSSVPVPNDLPKAGEVRIFDANVPPAK